MSNLLKDNIYKNVSDYVNQCLTGTQTRQITALSDNWRFHSGDPKDAWDVKFDDRDWRVLSVPHDYSIEGEFSAEHAANGFVQSGIVWYRKHLHLPENPLHNKYYLIFDGVSMNSQVWINDRYLGQRPYGFTPFWYDITPFVKTGNKDENVISVRVDCSLQPFARSYTGTGIFRNVWLVSANSLHVEQWGVVGEVKKVADGEAEVEVKTKLRVDRYPETRWNAFSWMRDGMEDNNWIEKTCTLVTSILDVDGNTAAQAEESFNMENFSKQDVKQSLIVSEPRLWSSEEPNMYHIHTKIYIDGTMVDDVLTPLGIRTISFDSKNGFLLNGKETKLKGVCLHQDSGIFGGAVPVKNWVKKLLVLKEAGCNGIRTSHHPFPTEFYHVCDALGFMVMDEAFDEWQMGWDRGFSDQPYGKHEYGYYLYFEQWHDTDLRAMLRRDRNHPSVIMWSVGNEIPELYFEEGIDVLKNLVRICKEEDTTRPVIVCAEGNHLLRILDGIMDQVDIAGYNYVNSREGKAYYSRFHEEHPDWVLLGSETEFEPAHWKMIMENPYVIGQFLWSGYDYLGEGADVLGEDSKLGNTFDITALATAGKSASKKVIRHGWAFGVVDITDTPKGEYFYRKTIWNDEPAVYLAVKSDFNNTNHRYDYFQSQSHWNWGLGSKKTIYCFTNCDKVELFLNGLSIGTKEKDPKEPFALEWDVDYMPGTLRAVGYKNDTPICENQLITAGNATSIQLESDTGTFIADGKDYAHIGISIVDENGVLVPDAANKLTAEVRGNGTVLGLFSADMTSNESYRSSSCNAFKGRCMVVVQSTQDAGPVELRIEGEGLISGTLRLDSKNHGE